VPPQPTCAAGSCETNSFATCKGCNERSELMQLQAAIPSEPYLPRLAGQGVNMSEIGINI